MIFSFLRQLLGRVLFFTGAIEDKNSFPKPLSSEEEAICIALSKQGDKSAREKLIRHNMRLVAHIVKKYAGAAETDDLISVGSIGLIKAVNTYESGRGTQLATYTARCIENEILMLIRSNKKYKNNLSLTEPLGRDKEGNELTLNDLLFEKEESVFRQVELSILNQRFIKIIRATLDDREYEIICTRYGLNGRIPLPQREVARKLKISRSYVSRIEKRAIEKLRDKLVKIDFIPD